MKSKTQTTSKKQQTVYSWFIALQLDRNGDTWTCYFVAPTTASDKTVGKHAQEAMQDCHGTRIVDCWKEAYTPSTTRLSSAHYHNRYHDDMKAQGMCPCNSCAESEGK